MATYLLAFGVFLLIVLGMSLGYLLQRKPIAGSCGGLGTLGIEKACDCDDPCGERKKRAAREARWQQHRIY